MCCTRHLKSLPSDLAGCSKSNHFIFALAHHRPITLPVLPYLYLEREFYNDFVVFIITFWLLFDCEKSVKFTFLISYTCFSLSPIFFLLNRRRIMCETEKWSNGNVSASQKNLLLQSRNFQLCLSLVFVCLFVLAAAIFDDKNRARILIVIVDGKNVTIYFFFVAFCSPTLGILKFMTWNDCDLCICIARMNA